MPEKMRKKHCKIAKGCPEYIQGDSLKFPPKNPKCRIVKKLESSRVASPPPSNLYENLKPCHFFQRAWVDPNPKTFEALFCLIYDILNIFLALFLAKNKKNPFRCRRKQVVGCPGNFDHIQI